MSFLLPKAPTPKASPPTPTIDDAVARMRDRDRNVGRRGRVATILTSEEGLPNLGGVGTKALIGTNQ